MATGYEDYLSQPTTATQIVRLKLHITELSKLLSPELSSATSSKSTQAIQAELKDLRAELKDLEARPDATSGGVVSVPRWNRSCN